MLKNAINPSKLSKPAMRRLAPYDSDKAETTLAQAKAAWLKYLAQSAADLFVLGLTRKLDGEETVTAIVMTKAEALAEADAIAAWLDVSPEWGEEPSVRSLRPYDTKGDTTRIRGDIRERWMETYRVLFEMPLAELKAIKASKGLNTLGNALEIPTARALHAKWTGASNQSYKKGGDALYHRKVVEVKFFDKGCRLDHHLMDDLA